MRYAITLAVVLAALWLGLSGVYKPLILLLGATSVTLVAWISVRMDVVGVEHNPVLFSWCLPVYWGWLVWQIVLANFQVAACALGRAQRIAPQVVRVPVKLDTSLATAKSAPAARPRATCCGPWELRPCCASPLASGPRGCMR